MIAPERWARVKELFDQALERKPTERDSFLSTACEGDEELRQEVVSLLASYQETDIVLDRPAAGRMMRGDPMEGKRLGPYRLVRKVGHGGMGLVYLAERADDQFRRRVAIKIVRSAEDDGQLLQRFHNERQTLAVLDHPNIVGLIDAGASEDGLAYLVMDYVEGQVLDEYASSRKLTLRERLELFRKICAAVHYAHQNLVIHRDLKPSNILVTADGEPKLLDFGIAKLIRPEYGAGAMGLTRTNRQPMTPAFASPEQLSGRPITTASDVYSLGVILYELLTGHHPFAEKSTSPADLAAAVCNEDPERPSRVTRTVEGGKVEGRTLEQVESDLDLIVLTAMRKEPQRRYGSVHDFSEDIRKYLEDLPISARKDTLSYRLSKLAARHKAGTAAAVVTAFALICAVIVSAWYAREARREQARAEHRLQDAVGFVGYLFEMDDAARSGSTQAREQAVTKTLESLNRLLAEAGPDPLLKRYLVEGYLRVGDMQGNPYGSNRGDTAGAMRSYLKAKELAASIPGNNPATQRDRVRADVKIADMAAIVGDRKKALDIYRQVLTGVEKSDGGDLQDLMMVLEKLAFTQFITDDLPGAFESYQRYVDVVRKVHAGRTSNAEARGAIAKAESRMGEILVRQDQSERGINKLRGAWQVQTELLAEDPRNPALQRAVAATAEALGDSLATAKQYDEAIKVLRRGVAVSEALLHTDPENTQYCRDFSLNAGFLANALEKMGNRQEGAQLARRSLEAMEVIADKRDASGYDHNNFAWMILNSSFPELKDSRKALRHAQLAVEKSKHMDSTALITLGLALEANGDYAGASQAWHEAQSLLPPGNASFSTRVELDGYLRRVQSKLPKEPAYQ